MDASIIWIGLGGLLAGLVGSLMGLGGGIVAVPYLSLVMGVPMHTAACAGLISTLSVSCSAAGNFLRQGGLINLQLALRLELFAASGGLLGGISAGWIEGSSLKIGFAGLMMLAAVYSMINERLHAIEPSSRMVISGTRRALSLGLCFVAGMASGLLGIGGGIVVVPVLYLVLGLPFKSATSTSNFMMGFTAIPALFGFIMREQLDLSVAVPLAAGVIVGANIGARILPRLRTRLLKIVFSSLLVLTAIQMAYEGVALW